MTVLAVDLAAKYSAACLMDENYSVLYQFDSWGVPEVQFIRKLVTMACSPSTVDVIVIEDLPHGLPYSTLIKTVLRLQGRVYHALSGVDVEHQVLFLAPAEWRKTFTGMERGTGSTVVVPVAATFGYSAPDLTDRALVRGGKALARKVATDYCSAYLIARWAVNTKKDFGTYDIVGTSRYDTAAIKKKDFDAEDR